MCAIIENRIRINKIMSLTLSTRLDNRPPNLEELTHLCVVALQIYYDGKCPEDCLEARARDFAAWHLAAMQDIKVDEALWPNVRSCPIDLGRTMPR
jgi:hypothetical protein